MKRITHLVLSSGGVKGFAMLGVLCRLPLQDVRFIAGTSVGAAIGLLLAIGYEPLEIFQELVERYQHDLRQLRPRGFSMGAGVLDWAVVGGVLEAMVHRKTGTDFTLLSLYETFGKELVCVTYNYTQRRVQYLNMQTYPDMPVLMACRMSCAIPFVFGDCYWGNDIFVDGVVYSHLPIECCPPEHQATAVAINLCGHTKKDAHHHLDNGGGGGGEKHRASVAARRGNLGEYLYNLLSIRLDADSKYKTPALGFRGRVVDVQVPLGSSLLTWEFTTESMCEVLACGLYAPME